MILTNRLFERTAPNRDAKSIYIFCEGVKRELQYFEYFQEMDSRINIEIYKLYPEEDNSPLGLLNIAEKCIIKSEENKNPKYEFIEGDEVWIVLDIDRDKYNSRVPQIKQIVQKCSQRYNWNLAQSNPCFEVWLYYHKYSEKPYFADIDKCKKWKQFVNSSIKGGFDSKRHPIYIEQASKNGESNFNLHNGKLDIGSTNVYNLANSIIPLIKQKLENALKHIEKLSTNF